MPRFSAIGGFQAGVVEFMDRMATARDAEGVSLGFVRMTMACAECHRHMRTPTVATLNLQPQRTWQSVLARLSPNL